MATLTDAEFDVLLRRARSGDSAASERIITALEPEIRIQASKLFARGSDRDDMIQEGRIGVAKAIATFDESRSSNFRHFAQLCIVGGLITAVKASRRFKHLPLSEAVSLDSPLPGEDDEAPRSLGDRLASPEPSALELIICQEEREELTGSLLARLTPFERRVFESYSPDDTYAEVGQRAGTTTKAVDNALIRVRQKARGVADAA